MVGRFYEPDEKICIIFDNVNYDKLREIPEFSKRHDNAANLGPLANEFHYHDIPLAREWADTFEEGIKAYGFSEEKTHRHKDSDFNTMKNAIMEANDKIRVNAERGRRTLLLFFYAGHGGTRYMEGTYAFLNSNHRGNKEGGNQFALEEYLENYCAR